MVSPSRSPEGASAAHALIFRLIQKGKTIHLSWFKPPGLQSLVRVALGNCHSLQYNFQMNNDLNVASKSREGEEDSMWFHVHQTWEKSRMPTSWKK